jgi:hypothetical protein
VQFRSYRAGQTDQASSELSRGLALVKPRRAEPPYHARSSDGIFSDSEMRHNFAIWALEKDAVLGRRLHLYYCVRCKWAFRVEDRRGLVTPLDANGTEMQGVEAYERLATFGLGPCPAFDGLLRNSRRTQKVAHATTFWGRLAALLWSVRRTCELRAKRWRQFDAPRSSGKQRSRMG